MLSKYRPEIDGLRALSVFIIILYHAKVSHIDYGIFSGGYLGVDIFLVISGYLITKIILTELISTESFSLLRFYHRRIKRLLPALIFVLATSIPIAWYCLLPKDLLDFTNSLFSTLFFFSNFFFFFEGKQYGATETLLLPLQHMWSLSLEEQFYLIFPIFLIIIFKFFKNIMEIALVFVLFTSLAMAHLEATTFKSSTYYFLHTRIWELIAGALIPFIERRLLSKKICFLFQKFATSFGLILIVFGLIFTGEETNHPSLFTTMPVCGTCLILLFSDKKDFATRVLSNRILVWFGVLSYSLYLWHFPLFAFYRVYFAGNDPLLFRLFLVILLILLSVITYFLVEKPFREKSLDLKHTLFFIFAGYFVLTSFVVVSFLTKGFEFRVPQELRNKLQRTNYYSSSYKKCHLGLEKKENTFCSFGDFKKQIVLVGDSHAGVLLNDLKIKAEINKYKFITMTRNAEELNFMEMSEYAQNRHRKLIQIKNSIIVIDGNYNRPGDVFDFEAQHHEFSKFLSNMAAKNNHVIFISPNPHIENPYGSLMNGMRYVRSFEEVGILDFKIDKKSYLSSLKSFSTFLKKILLEFDNVTLIDTSQIFCEKNHCYSIRNGDLLLFDTSHASDSSARKINDMIIEQANKIFLTF